MTCDSRCILEEMFKINNDLNMLGKNSPKLYKICDLKYSGLHPRMVNQLQKLVLQSNRLSKGSVVKDMGPIIKLADEDCLMSDFSERSSYHRRLY